MSPSFPHVVLAIADKKVDTGTEQCLMSCFPLNARILLSDGYRLGPSRLTPVEEPSQFTTTNMRRRNELFEDIWVHSIKSLKCFHRFRSLRRRPACCFGLRRCVDGMQMQILGLYFENRIADSNRFLVLLYMKKLILMRCQVRKK